MNLRHATAGFLATLLLAFTSAHAGHITAEPEGKKTIYSDEFPYIKGAHEIEVNVGGFGSIATTGSASRPDVGYAIGELRAGFMLSDPAGPGILRGNWEFVVELFGGGIFDGPGSYVLGADIFLRYNFVQPDAKLVPYIMIGGGGVYSDAADDDPIQRNIGSDLSFNLMAEIGVRYHLNRNFAIKTALEYRHISNADTASRNQGLNSLGGTLGASWFY
jgi:lipid A 3-O-deacylase